MNKIEYDTQTKQQIKDVLYSFLYDPVKKQFKDRIDSLILRNTIIGGHSHKHFTYSGSVYNSELSRPPAKKNQLHPLLHQQMDYYLADLDDINRHELPHVLGFINQVLNSTSDLYDYMRILLESINCPLGKMLSTYTCRTQHLDEDRVQHIVAKNHEPIGMIKRRLAANLLI